LTPPTYTELQLDALRELANIGSGTAGTALSQMLGRSIDVSVPKAEALSLADAVEAVGPAEETVTGVVMPITGDLQAIVLLIFPPADVAKVCALLGVEPDTEFGLSAVQEIGNIVGASYIGVMGGMAGMSLLPDPPQVAVDMLGAIAASVLSTTAHETDTALLLDSALKVEDEESSLSLLLLPSHDGVQELLERLGVGS
jgi:chemotaxis protein CheC